MLDGENHLLMGDMCRIVLATEYSTRQTAKATTAYATTNPESTVHVRLKNGTRSRKVIVLRFSRSNRLKCLLLKGDSCCVYMTG